MNSLVLIDTILKVIILFNCMQLLTDCHQSICLGESWSRLAANAISSCIEKFFLWKHYWPLIDWKPYSLYYSWDQRFHFGHHLYIRCSVTVSTTIFHHATEIWEIRRRFEQNIEEAQREEASAQVQCYLHLPHQCSQWRQGSRQEKWLQHLRLFGLQAL